jgi:hypothetical protein
MPVIRYKEKPSVALPPGLNEVPLIDPKKGPDHQLQQRLVARVKVFDLCQDTERAEYEKIWQMVCDGTALMSEHRTEFVAEKGAFIAMLRWSEFQYKLPDTGDYGNG